jgi:hypothetical protein
LQHRYTNNIQNVLNICNRAALAQRADGKSVTAVAIAVTKDDVTGWAADRQAVVAVVDDVVLE